MRIAVVSDAYYPYFSGVTEYAHGLATWLRKKGHSVDIITGSYGPEDKLYPAIRIGRVHRIPGLGSFATLPIGMDVPSMMRRIMEQGGYQIVHTNGPIFPDLSFFAVKYAKSPVVATFHTYSDRGFPVIDTIYRSMFSGVNEKIDVKIAVSRYAEETNKRFVPGDYVIVPNAVDTERFTPEGKKIQWMLDSKTVLFVGRLDRRKGLHRLIEAFRFIKSDAVCVVVGDGPLRERYVQQVKAYGMEDRFVFVGRVSADELPCYFRSAHVYTSPATGNESFGIVLIEAMASGTPVVASCIRGYDTVISSGENGILVKTENPIEYARALEQMLANEKQRRKFIRNGSIDVNEKYSWDVVTDRMIEIYNSLQYRLVHTRKKAGK